MWEFFLSHHQALGGDQMNTLSLIFERNNKKTVWWWQSNGVGVPVCLQTITIR